MTLTEFIYTKYKSGEFSIAMLKLQAMKQTSTSVGLICEYIDGSITILHNGDITFKFDK